MALFTVYIPLDEIVLSVFASVVKYPRCINGNNPSFRITPATMRIPYKKLFGFVSVAGILGVNSDWLKSRPSSSSYVGTINQGEYICIPVNSDTISKGFVKVKLSVNDSIMYGFKKSSYEVNIISGRQYDQIAQAGVYDAFTPQGNNAKLESVYMQYDGNAILRTVYLKFNVGCYVNIVVENASGGLSITKTAEGTAFPISSGWNKALVVG